MEMGTGRYQIVGKLRNTGRTVQPIRVGRRAIWTDDDGQLWVKCFNKWWRFPEEIEH